MKKININNYFDAKIIANALSDKIRSNSEENNALIDKWLADDVNAKSTLTKLSNEKNLIEIYNEFESIDQKHHENRKNLLLRTAQQLNRKKRQLVYKYLISSGAAAVAILLFVIYDPTSKTIESSKISSSTNNRPTLILSNGSNVDLVAANNTITDQDVIANTDTKSICYTNNTKESNSTNELSYHTIVVPEKFTYTITLADSTEVTLNANSELRYPTNFSSKSREVYLKGEAYFKVKKDKAPFIVRNSSVQIKVYGTQFNVNAYNENSIKTVLVTGSVGVRFDENQREQMITPNQMITVNPTTKESTIEHVDISRHTAWLSGYFRFDGEKLEDIIAEFSHWYHIDFQFTHESDKEIKLILSFDKNSSLEEILQTIESATNLSFKMKGGIYKIE